MGRDGDGFCALGNEIGMFICSRGQMRMGTYSISKQLSNCLFLIKGPYNNLNTHKIKSSML